MHMFSRIAVAGLATGASATSLANVCTVSNLQAALPANGTLLGIELIPSATTATAVYNGTLPAAVGSSSTSSTKYSYCNASITFTHAGLDDQVVLIFAFPDPSTFKNRFYVAGGEAYSLSTDWTGGLEYGAVGAITSAGYDAFHYSYDEVMLLANGTLDWDATYEFGYQALGEMTKVAKYIIPGFYALSNGTTNGTKIYTYYEGCSDGGRQGMSQVQRWGVEYDGAITGAPAFRFAQQQTNHIFSSVVEHTLDYYPPPCALDKIVNATIAACDPLDGRTDGVISRPDLCQLQFNLTSVIGKPYYCAAETGSSLGFGFNKLKRQQTTGSTISTYPAQNGTVSAQDISVVQTIYNGLHNRAGERAYLSWAIGAELEDAATAYDNATGSWTLDITSLGGEFVSRFVELLDLTNLSTLDGVTYDTVVEWMNIAYYRFTDSLQTTVPDLTPFQSSGGKLLHYHGGQDPSVPTASSIHYFQSVRKIMYPHLSDEEAHEALSDWYQLYLIPGAAHCGANDLEPGPYPENNMDIMIDWVENGVKPTRLPAVVSSGPYEGEVQDLCQWPLQPLWHGNLTTFECVYDQAGVEAQTYEFPAFKIPIF